MLVTTQGIVLRSVNYGETSVILDIYTKDFGRRSYILNGVRKKNAAFKQALVNVSSWVEMVTYHRDDKDLLRIKEVKPHIIYESIPFDVIKGTVSLFMTELLEKTVRESEKNVPLFQYIEQSYRTLDRAEKTTYFPLGFPIGLMQFLGFAPSTEHPKTDLFLDIREGRFVPNQPHIHYLDETLSQFWKLLEYTLPGNPPPENMNKSERQALLDGIMEYYKFHIEGFKGLNSLSILRIVLSTL